ncbi:sortase [Bengtsoniella intestinalis]|uniref:sortase n=1 Tax=Bengtsoniella intestinalis TaxID=3073143 RepID=UPI00391EF4B4
MKKVLRSCFILLGVACMSASGFLYWQGQTQEDTAQVVSLSVAQTFQETMKQEPVEGTQETQTSVTAATSVAQTMETSVSGAVEVATVEIDGQGYIGLMSIPQLGLELPVASTYTDAKVKQTPCVYVGSFEEGYLVIGAHNYAAHFGNLDQLLLGDEISILDTYGYVHTYVLGKQESIAGTDVEALCLGDWDLTLFTCVYGNNTQREVLRFYALGVESVDA